MATEADVNASDRRAAIVALNGEAAAALFQPYINDGDTFFVGPRVRAVAVEMAAHRLRAEAVGYARCVEHALCEHEERAPGPRLRLIGNMPASTEVCRRCGAWRMTHRTLGMWRPGSTLADEPTYEDPL